MENEKNAKKNKKISKAGKERAALLLAVILIAAYIFFECYSATHVPLETCTAMTATVYERIETTALVVRDEHVIEGAKDAVTVASALDGEKVAKNGRIAMKFASSEDAEHYAQKTELEQERDYYAGLESKSNASATDVQAIDNEILDDVNTYVRALAASNMDDAQTAADAMNDTFTRRQMIIGTEIDFSSIMREIESKLDAVDASCKPTGYITTDDSGIFSGYTDGCESVFDYSDVQDMTVAQWDQAMQAVDAAQSRQDALGKLITSYAWYFCCKVSTKEADGIENGDVLDVAIKDSDRVLSCTVVSGAESKPGAEQTVLILQCADMDSEIAAYRAEDIEIRYAEHTGIKAPAEAVHVCDGEKGVYVLVAGQVKFRQAQVLYTAKDYVILQYEPENTDAIRLYDEIITEGKDLYDGKVYT